MERDGISRVYVSSGGEPHAWLLFPEAEKTRRENMLYGDAAIEVLGRKDFVCVNSESFERAPNGGFGKQVTDEWGCYAAGEFCFSIDRTGVPDDDRFAQLVQVLEEKAGKTGLTIIVY